MRSPTLIVLAMLTAQVSAQVELSVPITLSGTLDERRVVGLGVPDAEDVAIAVDVSLMGMINWAEAIIAGDSVTLSPVVPLDNYRDGQILRFKAPTALAGYARLACTGSVHLPLTRTDGLPLALGQVVAGQVCEVMLTPTAWIMLNAPERGCPAGTVQVHANLCMEPVSIAATFFYPASDRCNALGGRLCSWDEFYYACSTQLPSFPGMTSAWEWIDDASNHAHTSVQVGNANCTAQRSAPPQLNVLGRSRCCFTPR